MCWMTSSWALQSRRCTRPCVKVVLGNLLSLMDWKLFCNRSVSWRLFSIRCDLLEKQATYSVGLKGVGDSAKCGEIEKIVLDTLAKVKKILPVL